MPAQVNAPPQLAGVVVACGGQAPVRVRRCVGAFTVSEDHDTCTKKTATEKERWKDAAVAPFTWDTGSWDTGSCPRSSGNKSESSEDD